MTILDPTAAALIVAGIIWGTGLEDRAMVCAAAILTAIGMPLGGAAALLVAAAVHRPTAADLVSMAAPAAAAAALALCAALSKPSWPAAVVLFLVGALTAAAAGRRSRRAP